MAQLFDSQSAEAVERFCNEVGETILNQSMALFTGAGTSVQYGGKNWQGLIANSLPASSKWSETEYAQYLILNGIQLKENIAKNLLEFKKTIDTNNAETYLYYLLDFDIDSIWTTNYDSVIEDVLTAKGKIKHEIYSYNDFKIISSPTQSFLYKINGSLNDASSIIVTKEDFISYRHTREGFLILLKRDLLCKNFLFIGTSFRDDVLRTCIKDIQYCISNNDDNFITQHYAIIASSDEKDLNYVANDIVKNYSINCITVNNTQNAYLLAKAITQKVKFKSIFISGAKRFVRGSKEEKISKELCSNLVKVFTYDNENNVKNEAFKMISGMGMSIGNFISGATKSCHKDKNINRYLKMAPFPFENAESKRKHREQLIKYSGIFIFMYGDKNNKLSLKDRGMWKEYEFAKSCPENIIIALPIENSISIEIYREELSRRGSFTQTNRDLFEKFSSKKNFEEFFQELYTRVTTIRRKFFDKYFKDIVANINLRS